MRWILCYKYGHEKNYQQSKKNRKVFVTFQLLNYIRLLPIEFTLSVKINIKNTESDIPGIFLPHQNKADFHLAQALNKLILTEKIIGCFICDKHNNQR